MRDRRRIVPWLLGLVWLTTGVSQIRADLFVVSIQGAVLRYNGSSGEFVSTFVSPATGGLSFPVDLKFGPDGNLYVSSSFNNRVMRYDGMTGDVIDVFVSDPSSTNLSFPQGITFGPDQHLYVTSGARNTVLQYDGQTGAFRLTFIGDNSATPGIDETGGLSGPFGVTFGPDGNFYVGSFDPPSKVIQYDGVSGEFLRSFVSPGDAGINQPEGLIFGPDGHLYVANGGGQNVLRFDGTSGVFIDEFVTQGSGGLITAVGISFGPDGNLFVSSNTNSRVLRYDGLSGDFIDTFVPDGSGGLFAAQFIAFDSTAPDLPPFFIGPTVSQTTVDANCEGDLTFSATVLDDHGVSEFDVFVQPDLIGGAATVDSPNIVTVQVDEKTVQVEGSIHVSDITECPVVFQVTLFAFDNLGQLSDPGFDFGAVYDEIPPTVTVPSDLMLSATPSPCEAIPPVPPLAAATDNCTDPTPITFERSDGQPDVSAPYACADSPVTITWIATDACGNTTTGTQLVFVVTVATDCNSNGVSDDLDIAGPTSEDCDTNAIPDECETDSDSDGTIDACDGCPNDPNKTEPGACGCGVAESFLTVDIELSPTLADSSLNPGDTLGRCITFELWECPTDSAPSAVVEQVVDFPVDDGSPHRAEAVSMPIPCGNYSCATARDRLHALRSTAPDFTGDGANYTATFVGNRSTGGHWLIQGNLNDDKYIDVWDFAYYINRFGLIVGAGDSNCSTPFAHPDIDGDGMVFTSDFTFIAVSILKVREPNCCGADGLMNGDQDTGPAIALSVADLWRSGLGELATADLNGDGLIDPADMAAYSAASGCQLPGIVDDARLDASSRRVGTTDRRSPR